VGLLEVLAHCRVDYYYISRKKTFDTLRQENARRDVSGLSRGKVGEVLKTTSRRS